MIVAGAATARSVQFARVAAAGLAAIVLGCGLAACTPHGDQSGRPVKAAPTGPTYETVLRETNAAIASGEGMVKDPIESALVPLELISLYTERARLTGSYDDYGRAEALLARLEPQYGGTDGVCLARAKLNYAVHRLAAARQILDGCPRIAGSVEDLLLRADIAFHTGRYKDAGAIYRALVNQVGTPQTYIQLALHSAKTGSPGEAAAFLEAAEKRYHGASPVMASWFALQRGLIELDRGRYEEARALFALADQRLPGYWLNEEHLGEAAELMGDTPRAKAIYEEVVRKTGLPEYLDALGSIEAQAGNSEIARKHLARAEAIYAQRAKRFPEAIAGHALEHYLDAAPDPAKALTLARANFENRPYGDAAIALAKAQLLDKRPAEAASLLEQQIAQGWDTAEAYWILSLAAKASGNVLRADTAAREAIRRNPQSATQYVVRL